MTSFMKLFSSLCPWTFTTGRLPLGNWPSTRNSVHLCITRQSSVSLSCPPWATLLLFPEGLLRAGCGLSCHTALCPTAQCRPGLAIASVWVGGGGQGGTFAKWLNEEKLTYIKSHLDIPQIGLWFLKAVEQGACHMWYRLNVPLSRPPAP